MQWLVTGISVLAQVEWSLEIAVRPTSRKGVKTSAPNGQGWLPPVDAAFHRTSITDKHLYSHSSLAKPPPPPNIEGANKTLPGAFGFLSHPSICSAMTNTLL